MRAALVITTYNNPKYLGLCLVSLAQQTSRDFDIFIADDGSSDETKFTIDAHRPFFSGRKIEHFWHPDQGYQKSAINNEVFRHLCRRREEYPVVICVDHDVLLHPNFVADHLSVHRRVPNACFMGRRVELGPEITATVNEANAAFFCRGMSARLIFSGFKGDSKNVFRSCRISSGSLQRLLKRDRVRDLLGSNFSVTTDLLCRTNGYNEDYRSYWGEDGDLFVRLRNIGAKLVGLKGFAIQYHLHHRRLEPDRESQARYLELLKDTAYVRCRNGIVKD